MSITIPDEIYEELLVASGESLRPIATEAVYRIRVGLRPINLIGGQIPVVGTMVEPKKEETKLDEGWLYSEVIAKIGGSMDREVDFEERSQINKMVKDAGLVWNVYKKRLERPLEGGEFKLIHQF